MANVMSADAETKLKIAFCLHNFVSLCDVVVAFSSIPYKVIIPPFKSSTVIILFFKTKFM